MSSYQRISNNIQQIVINNPRTSDKQLIWINITNAGKSEIEYLRKNYNFNLAHLHASSAKTTSQRTLISQGNGYIFIILHFPIFQNNIIMAGEVEFFISNDYLITLHNNNMQPLNDFFNLCKKDSDSLLAYEFESSAVLLYELLDKLIQSCYLLLDRNSLSIQKVEEVIFAYDPKHAVAEILSLRHNIINFRKIMQNHKNMIKKLLQLETKIIPSDQIKKYYRELIEHSKRIWEILENQKEIVEALNNTNESMLNYQISNVMKTLTIFSVIVFPLTLLAAIFGMNVEGDMPFINNPYGFWIVISIMLFGSLIMLMFFEKKKWL
jgi:magnesium transporter